ncbi:MAG: response regulator [Chitinispirillales bacterium]|jgi:signal transduction histidine kinase/DNA-binding response OmpR family regulator|nr:response regulator [Chitinispirillales bacterium]
MINIGIHKKIMSRPLYLQLLFVASAFTLMVFASYMFVNNMLMNYLKRDADHILTQTQLRITDEFREAQTVMIPVVKTVRDIIMRGGTANDVKKYYDEISEELLKKEYGFIFNGFHGYFEGLGNVIVHSWDWTPPDNFLAAERPWYKAAVEAEGKIVSSPMFWSVHDKEYQVTFVCRIFDDNGKPLGVVAMNAPFRNIIDLVVDTRLTKNGYGFLVNEEYEIVAHPKTDFLTKHLEEASPAFAHWKDKIKRGKHFSKIARDNYKGTHSIFYFKRIDNGWYLGIVTPKSEYYKDLNTLLAFLGIFGIIMTGAVFSLLIRIDRAKTKSDRVYQEQRIQPALMEKTREANKNMETLLQSMDTMLIITEIESDNILFMNERMKKEFGFRDKIIGEKCWKLLVKGGTERCGFCPKNNPGFISGNPVCWEFHNSITDRDYRIVSRFIDWPDGSTVFMEQCDDITELKESINKAQAANHAKTSFLANMSHEIRTPMNSIIGFAELAKDEDLSVKAAEYLDNISSSSRLLLQIINDILDVSKIEAGKMELEHIPFDLHDVFAHCQSIIMPKVVEKGIALYCCAEPFVGKKLLGDPVKLRQVLLNMLSNAVKFTNVGTVKLLASAKENSGGSVIVHFEIKDSGIGMTSEQINLIFDPFTQGDESIARKYGGTGLGLTITKNFIEMMGGKLEVESTPGVGSKFRFEIKFDIIDAPVNELSEKAVFQEIEKPIFKGEVLICEDNIMNQQMVCRHLEKVGLQAVVANDGQEGIDTIRRRIWNGEKPFDLIFMDIHMPVLDGLEAASQITALGVKTPIVALTANILTNNIELYAKSGMSGHLGKPFTTQELWRCLMNHLMPVTFYSIDKRQKLEDDKILQKRLKLLFVKNNRNMFAEIQKAAAKDNIKLAHRLVHALKSSAGQIGEKDLQTAAAVAEGMLLNGKNLLTQTQSDILEAELKSVLEKLAPLLDEAYASSNERPVPDMEETRKLFEKLELMLKNSNPECINLLDDIRVLPQAEELVQQLTGFKFKKALTALSRLREGIGC